MKFLLVEDDVALAGAVEQLLAEHHYVMDLATDGIMGRDMAEAFPYDLILLDWSLPKLEGVELCKYLRNEGNYTPIILLTARNESTDKVAGLDAGADDYLVKPFGFEELLARIRALLRRAEGIVSPVLQWGDLCLDPRSSEVTCRSVPIPVTPKEYALLELFLRNPSRIFSLDALLDRVWPFDDTPNVGSVRTHIKGLRQKLKKAGLPDMVTTVYGLGYRLKSADFVRPPQADVSDAEVPSVPATAPLVDAGKGDSDSSGGDSRREVNPGKLDLSSLWQGMSETYIKRVVKVANTLRILQPGLVEKPVAEKLLKEAHSLAGSLGSFGFQPATTNCREIEAILRANAYLSAQHVHQLEMLITQVQQVLEQGLAQPTPSPAQAPAKEEAESGVLASMPASVPLLTPIELLPGQLFQLLMVKARNDRDASWLKSLTAEAVFHQIQVRTVDDIDQARRMIFPEGDFDSAHQPPHIVVFDFDGSEHLPGNDSPEFELLADLQTAQPPIPPLVLTAVASFENRVRVARLGVAGLLQTPVTPTEVLETAVQVLQKGVVPTAKLLIVDDDPAMLTLLQSILHPWGFRLQLLSDPQNFWQVLERFEPDLVLLDVQMTEISGFDLCQVIRNAPHWQEMPVLFMSGYTDADTIQQVFSVGADDYIRKPIVAPELVARVLSWLERSRTRRLRADVDSLSGIANRQKSTQLITRMMSLAQRYGETLCFAVVDFDHLKEINDKYGHSVGDRILRRFGEKLRSTFRTEDAVGRWGGEEFVIALYGMSRREGAQRLRQFLQDWQQEQFNHSASAADDEGNPESQQKSSISTFSMTFTAGVAVYPHDGSDLKGLYRAADQALYKAKVAGRNRIGSVE
ncbi:MAG: response regulator [Phormidesmis sp.]